jgi:hypothetical protein
MCDRGESIVDYVYDELSSAQRRDFDAHLATCAACRTEVGGLTATRRQLASWKPPEPDLGFRVIRGGAAPAQALPRRSRFAPAFAFAAAAVIVLAVAAAIANIEVRYDGDGSMTVRTGWAAGPAGSGGPQTGVAQARDGAVPSPGTTEFAALDRRLREIEAAMTTAPAPGPGVQLAADSRLSDAEILGRVRQLVREAEARQEAATAQRLLDVFRDFDQQRRADLALIQQGLGHYQGLTNAEIAQNRELVNQLVRAASRQEK